MSINPQGNGRQGAQNGAAPADEQTSGRFDSVKFDSGLEWRSIGPFRGGRCVAVAGDPTNQNVYYFGSTGGGVWKTNDGGRYWRNVSDGSFKRASVGSIAVSPSDPNVIYVGMGEATIRGNVSHGDGVYKSTDAGATWQHIGLAETRNIGKVRVHPENPDIVYVAALGHAHGPNKERGIFRSQDGGKTWQQVLFTNEDSGVNDLSIDPTNPRRLYATFWQARRYPHQLVSGGPGCAIYRSEDGGDTWTNITHNKGLPKGQLGKIGIAASPAQAGRVYALVESEEGVIFRSDDAGNTWECMSDEQAVRQRPWYYMHIVADPNDADTIWALNVRLWKSIDGGKTFARMPIPHGDNHDLWIDPNNSQRMIEGNDGGATVSVNGGQTWSTIYNQPTCEFYHVTTDDQIPYRIYGAQQDNSTISVPSRSDFGAIADADYLEIGGGESGYIAVRPGDARTIFAGSYQGLITRYDRRTQQRQEISVWPEPMMGWPAKDARYRFQWTYPIMLSPHNPNVLYCAGNHVFRTTNDGHSWDEISPDLTRNDASRLGDTGGPLTNDNCGTEYYGTIFALAESPKQPGVLWAGSDDGLVHVTRDGGQNWQNVTPQGLPEWSLISIIDASPHDPAVAYLAANRYKHDDFAPYVFKTDDYGQHWTQITNGLPHNTFSRTIREDPERRGLLFAGTETGIYISFDDGANWRSFKQNLPVVPVHDLIIKGSDVIVATHGRSFWVLDDITPLRHLQESQLQQPAQLFTPRTAIRWGSNGGWGSGKSVPGVANYQRTGTGEVAFIEVPKPGGEEGKRKVYLDAGANPANGVYVNFLLNSKPQGEVTLTFYDNNGNEIRSFSSEERKRRISYTEDTGIATGEPEREKPEDKVPTELGINRFNWDMAYPPARPVEGFVSGSGEVGGPAVAPGHYRVKLQIGNFSQTAEFDIISDPRIEVSQQDLQEQLNLLMQIRDKVSQTHEAIDTIQTIREQAQEWIERVNGSPNAGAIKRAGEAVLSALKPIDTELIDRRMKERDDTLRFNMRLNNKLAELYDTVASADAAPTVQAAQVFQSIAQRVDAQIDRLREVVNNQLADFNRQVRESGVAAVVPSGELAVKHEAKTLATAGVPGQDASDE